jgi:putative flippase GtrA
MSFEFAAILEKNKLRYLRAQLVAVFATSIDFGATMLLKEGFKIYYVIAVASGACCGAVTAFILNRNWVFAGSDGRLPAQALRFAVALSGSALLNTTGTYAVTEYFHCHYLLSKIIVAVIIGLSYSYFVLKYFVFGVYEKK